MKGIILAGGSGTRLYPVTNVVCKQLLPVYDKPLIYYPLSVFMTAGIRDILIISTPKDTPVLENFLGNGENLGISISYKVQEKPNGIAEAFILGEEFIGDDSCSLILGDNIFYGNGLQELLLESIKNNTDATIFGYTVKDPERYGIVEMDSEGNALSIEEKPVNPKSSIAVVGLYIYNNDVVRIAKNLKPSNRGELEITDLNKEYLNQGKLKVVTMGRGYVWLDTGTNKSMIDAATFVHIIEERKGIKIACLEEIAYLMGHISKEEMHSLAQPYKNSSYGQYILSVE